MRYTFSSAALAGDMASASPQMYRISALKTTLSCRSSICEPLSL